MKKTFTQLAVVNFIYCTLFGSIYIEKMQEAQKIPYGFYLFASAIWVAIMLIMWSVEDEARGN